MLLGSTDPGYFEFNGGGVRIPGVRHRVRWTGRDIWEDDVHSTHFSDQDMPIKDSRGDGSCANCHNVHGSAAQHDMLHNNYRGITGSEFGLQPQGYAACLVCHSINGPLGMDESSRSIGYYYDRSVNPEHSSGHGISQGGGYVATGSRLPCFDCHNPHGSMGHDAQRPNRYLLSDQRPGWFGLDDIKNDNRQVRRFCFGCHPPADRTHTRSEAVEGLILPRLTGAVFAHSEDADRHCYDCHGRDYTSPTARNVHNPAKGVTPLIDDVTR